MRMRQIMDPLSKPTLTPRRTKVMAAAAAAFMLGTTFSAQMVMAQSAAKSAEQKSVTFSVPPLAGKITSAFGTRIHPVTGEEHTHQGTDIKGETGDPIVAPAAGTVTGTKFYKGYGNLLTLDHGNGYVSRYAQLSVFDRSVGDRVNAGQVIAQVGSTGRSTGPHLHLEVLKDGEHIDPQSVMTLGLE